MYPIVDCISRFNCVFHKIIADIQRVENLMIVYGSIDVMVDITTDSYPIIGFGVALDYAVWGSHMQR